MDLHDLPSLSLSLCLPSPLCLCVSLSLSRSVSLSLVSLSLSLSLCLCPTPATLSVTTRPLCSYQVKRKAISSLAKPIIVLCTHPKPYTRAAALYALGTYASQQKPLPRNDATDEGLAVQLLAMSGR